MMNMHTQMEMESSIMLRMKRMEELKDAIDEEANKHLSSCEKLDKELVGNRKKLDEYDMEYRKLRDEEDIMIKRQREIDKLKDTAKNKRRNLRNKQHALEAERSEQWHQYTTKKETVTDFEICFEYGRTGIKRPTGGQSSSTSPKKKSKCMDNIKSREAMSNLPAFRKIDRGKAASPSPYAGVAGKQNKKVEGWLSKEKNPLNKRGARSVSEDSEDAVLLEEVKDEVKSEVKAEVKSEVKVENKAEVAMAANKAEMKKESKVKTDTNAA